MQVRVLLLLKDPGERKTLMRELMSKKVHVGWLIVAPWVGVLGGYFLDGNTVVMCVVAAGISMVGVVATLKSGSDA